MYEGLNRNILVLATIQLGYPDVLFVHYVGVKQEHRVYNLSFDK